MQISDYNSDSSSEIAPDGDVGFERCQETSPIEKPPRIGGLLILVAIGLFLSLLRNIGYFLGSITPFIRPEMWSRYTNQNSTAFHPQWKLVIIFDAVTYTLTFFLNVVLLVFFFQKKRAFPKLIAVSIPIFFFMSLGGYYLAGLIPAVAETKDYSRQWHLLITQFVSLHLWLPYFLLSKRVEKTFVR
jgi:hypothetical protein